MNEDNALLRFAFFIVLTHIAACGTGAYLGGLFL